MRGRRVGERRNYLIVSGRGLDQKIPKGLEKVSENGQSLRGKFAKPTSAGRSLCPPEGRRCVGAAKITGSDWFGREMTAATSREIHAAGARFCKDSTVGLEK